MRSFKSFIAVAALLASVTGPVLADTAGVAGSTSTTATGTVKGVVDANNAGAAADTSTSTNGSATATTGSANGTNVAAGAAGNATANANGSAEFGQVMSSVNGSQAGSAQIQGMTSVASVSVVKIGDIATGDNQAALDTAMAAHKQDMVKLRTAVCSNRAIEAALSKKSVDCKTIVAANVEGGALIVYVK